jgi:DGQHR domain-containing protein
VIKAKEARTNERRTSRKTERDEASRVIRLPAIQVSQGRGRKIFSFAVDGKVVPEFAAISRLHRDGNGLGGYQRPEVISHIAEIRQYLESESPMIPNAVVIAFTSQVRFEPEPIREGEPAYTRRGVLVIPIHGPESTAEKAGFVVDGQQRLAAIRDASIETFPMCVAAFLTDDSQEQTEQFILVNSTKPLPKGLIYELLPNTKAQLPTLLHRRRFPAYLLERLNLDEASPLRNRIATPTNPDGLIKDNSILKMLENSLSDGALYRFRDASKDEPDTEGMLKVLFAFWAAVADVFEKAWDLPPRQSRLVHGAGIVSMGFLMDAISDRYRAGGGPTKAQFVDDLSPLRDACRWTDGYWDLGPGCLRAWNEIQNTPKDVQVLSNYLLVQYRELVRGVRRASGTRRGS